MREGWEGGGEWEEGEGREGREKQITLFYVSKKLYLDDST